MSGTTVGLLRIRGAREDTPALRLGLTSLLATGDVQPPALPPAAILVLRRLADPLPGRLPARRRGVRLDARWEDAVRTAVADRYRRAARPAAGPVSDDADAVLFADEAELLACLALDLARGVRARWWWTHMRVARTPNAGEAVARTLIERAVHVPAACDLLDRAGVLEEVLSTLTPEAASWTRRRVAVACGCPALATSADEARQTFAAIAHRSSQDATSSGPHAPPAATRTGREGTPVAAVSVSPVRPWDRAIARVLSAAMSHEVRALAGVALMIHRRPAMARTTSFAESFLDWYVAPETVDRPERQMAGPPGTHDAAPRGDEQRRVPPGSGSIVAPTDVRADGVIPANSAPPTPASVTRGDVARRNDNVAKAHSDASETPIQPSVAWTAESAVTTELAGAFYLVNVMRQLDLPERLEDQWRLASEVGAWGTLEQLAVGLLGAQVTSYAGDGIWPLLASLDGRAADAVTAPVLTPWLSSVLPVVADHLVQALRLAEADRARAGTLLLCHHGRVHHTPSHIDVVMPLDLVCLPVRVAGLDRNPGWAPAFGRVISFHFE